MHFGKQWGFLKKLNICLPHDPTIPLLGFTQEKQNHTDIQRRVHGCSRRLYVTDKGTKDPDAGKDQGQEEKGAAEGEMVVWHHRLNGHEFEQVLGVGDGQGGLVCYSPQGLEEPDMTECLNNKRTKGKTIQCPPQVNRKTNCPPF